MRSCFIPEFILCKSLTAAVGVDGDASQFPEGWLFKHRWGKGKSNSSDLILPSGEIAVIKWITVGSRTTAFVPEVQVLAGNKGGKKLKDKDIDPYPSGDSSLSELEDEELPAPESTNTIRKAKILASTDEELVEYNASRKRSKLAEELSPTEDLIVPKRRRSSRLISQA